MQLLCLAPHRIRRWFSVHARPGPTIAAHGLALQPLIVMTSAILSLAGCGGGSGDYTDRGAAPLPPPTAYSVVVKTVDTQGQPIAGVGVDLNGGFNGMTSTTGSDGTTTFNINTRGTDASVGTYMAGYHRAWRRFQLDSASGPVVQQLTLIRTDEAQLAVIGVTSETSTDASSVVVDAAIGAFDQNGNPIETLTTADFTILEPDCFGFGFPCILEPNGEPTSSGLWYPSRTSPVMVTPPVTGQAPHYKVRYVLESNSGMFKAGRTVFTWINVRLGADTSVDIQVEARL